MVPLARLEKWVKQEGYKIAGPSEEVYFSVFGIPSDEQMLEIRIPVRSTLGGLNMAVEQVGEKYRCNICGNEVTVTKVGGGTLVCCGEDMEKLD